MTRQEQVDRELLGRPVHSLQYMLRRLSGIYDFLPEIAVDGVFGEATLEAVMLFQRELWPPVTGVVDRGTWNALRDAWQAAEQELAEARGVRLFPAGEGGVEAGLEREFMILPQTMFQVLSRYLEGIEPQAAAGVHDGLCTSSLYEESLDALYST